MSCLVQFRILERRQSDFTVEVNIIHPDEHRINATADFGMRIILEHFENIGQGFIYNAPLRAYPYDEAASKALVTTSLEQKLEPLLTLMNGQELPLSQAEYDALRADDQSPQFFKGQKVSGYGHIGDKRWVSFEPDFDGFCQAAEKLIDRVEVLSHTHYPHWHDRLETWFEHGTFDGFDGAVYDAHKDDPYPSYVLKFHVTDPALLTHMVEGSSWPSAAYVVEGLYSTSKYQPNYTVVQPFVLDPDTDTEPPSQEEIERWWSGLGEDWKKLLQVNLALQQRAFFDRIMSRAWNHTQDWLIKHFHLRSDGQLSPAEVAQLPRMQALLALGSTITDLEPITMLQGLKIVELESLSLSTLEPLTVLPNLKHLNIYSVEALMACVGALDKLQTLYADPQQQADIDAVTQLTTLKELHLFARFELDASGFERLTNLKKLSVSSETIPKEGLGALQRLHDRGVEIDWQIGEDDDPLVFPLDLESMLDA